MANAVHVDREWLGLRQLTEYAAVSERTLRAWMHRQVDPLPAVQVDGKSLCADHSLMHGWERYVG
jgi:hypothetical protein